MPLRPFPEVMISVSPSGSRSSGRLDAVVTVLDHCRVNEHTQSRSSGRLDAVVTYPLER